MDDENISILDYIKQNIKSPLRILELLTFKPELPHPEEGSQTPPEPDSAQETDSVLVEIALTLPPGGKVSLTVGAAEDAEGQVSAYVEGDQLPGDLIVAAYRPGEKPVMEKSPQGAVAARIEQFIPKIKISAAALLFVAALGLYFFTRFDRLTQFPIYFFSDEAAQTLFAEKLVQNDYAAPNDKRIPIYVPVEGDRWSPMVSSYFQSISLQFAGKSVEQTRATSILVGGLAVIAVALILKIIFEQKYWWLGVLFMALIPAWFLHSRTAFETVMATGFYAATLLFYLLYRLRSPKWIFALVISGALTFYAYTNAQAMLGVLGLALLIVDGRYHFTQRKYWLFALPLLLFAAIPFIVFTVKLPGAIEQQLKAVDSYWYGNIPINEKVVKFVQNYLAGLSPLYWYLPNEADLVRHRMVGYAHLPLWSLPLAGVGLALAFKNFRNPAHRAVILAMLAVPVGGAMLQISIPRVLALVVPASILTMLGLEWLIEKLSRWLQPRIFAGILAVAFAAAGLLMLNDALTSGPRWTNMYGLYGLQYGGQQVFKDALPAYLENPQTRVWVTPVWANATDRLRNFFMTPEDSARVTFASIETFLLSKQSFTPDDLFVLVEDEYRLANTSGKFKEVRVEEVIPYPDGSNGFYLVRLAYLDNIDEIFAAEKAERSKPLETEVTLDGQSALLRYSLPDGGQPTDIFDGSTDTLMRGLEANPYLLDLTFTTPRALTGLALTTATMPDFTVTVSVYAPGATEPVVYTQDCINLPFDPTINFDFSDGPQLASRLVIEIKDNLDPAPHIHIRELKLK